jgi:pantoate--beta-alanine ligase
VSIPLFFSVKELRAQIAAWRAQGQKIALTPTMGALHAGHLSLVQEGFKRADKVIATIFVNPTQFGPGEDFDRYPRQEQADADMLASVGCSGLYRPNVAEMYAPGFCTTVSVGGLTQDLCGVSRPTHFDGVSTVVTKLLLQALPDIALFGEKDYQQLTIIRRTVRDLDIPVEIVGVPTLRESDGLAMSSRNRYLNERERAIAPLMYRTLTEAGKAFVSGKNADEACEEATNKLLEGGFLSVDYVAIRDAESLDIVDYFGNKPARILAAAKLGSARLIDNVAIPVDQIKV